MVAFGVMIIHKPLSRRWLKSLFDVFYRKSESKTFLQKMKPAELNDVNKDVLGLLQNGADCHMPTKPLIY